MKTKKTRTPSASHITICKPRVESLEDRSTPAFLAAIDAGTLAAPVGFALNGFENNSSTGESVASIGDVNADGFADIAIVAATADAGGTDKGQVYVVFGSKTGFPATTALNTLNGTNGFTINGIADNDQLGEAFVEGSASVAGLGDVNGDGIDDFVVASDSADGGGTNKGQAYVIFGSKTAFPATFDLTTLNGTNGFTVTGAANNDQIGSAVGGGADVNGDGLNDVFVGSPRVDVGGNARGQVQVIFGSKTAFPANLSAGALNGVNGFVVNGIADNDNLGQSVAGLRDVNGDGLSDFVTSADSADGGGTNKGQAYVIFGNKAGFGTALTVNALNGTNGFSITGKANNDTFGQVVGNAGDVNGDALGDIVIGNDSVAGNGQAYVVFGSKNGFGPNLGIETLNGSNGFTVTGIAAGDDLGRSVGGGRDVNADGLDDIILGAPGRDNGGTDKGSAYVIFGSKTFGTTFNLATINGTNGFELRGVANNDALGGSVALLQDINGDGAGEAIAAAPFVDLGGTNKGQVYVVLGQDTIAPTAKLTAEKVTRASNPLTYTFVVAYTDGGVVNAKTLDANDLQVIAPDGTILTAEFVSVTSNVRGVFEATYKITPPGGRWDTTDRGDYAVKLLANQVVDLAGNFAAATDLGKFTVDIPPVSQAEVVRFAVSPGTTGGGTAKVFNADGTTAFSVDAFPGFTGGARVVTADVNGDGVDDLVVGTGPGGVTSVKVFDGKTKAEIFTVQPFETAFTGGVFVAAADFDGDGKAEVIVTPDQGGGPVVAVYGGALITSGKLGDAAQITRFFGIEDANFRGGARAAAADLNGDGVQDLIVAAGFGGGPRIAVFNGKTVLNPVGSGQLPPKLLGDFFVFEDTLRNGVFIAGGDLNGDGFAEVIAGGGPGGGPRVFALSGKDLVGGKQVVAANFFAGDPNSRGGVRVAVKDLDGDRKSDIVTGAGDGAGSKVNSFLGKNIPADGAATQSLNFDAFAGFLNGVFVG